MRDTRKTPDYFDEFLLDIEQGITETQDALDAGNFTSPSERVDVAQRIYQLAIMRAVAHYSRGAHLSLVKQHALAILDYRKQLSAYCDKLPQAHQIYRNAFEKLGGQIDAVGSPNINRYIYTLWWLSLLQATGAEQTHINQALEIIGEQGKDALLDAIANALGDNTREMANSLYYPELYQPLYQAVIAAPQSKPELINQFIATWYDQLEDLADWYNSHECDCEFEYTDYYTGYWCLEAALVANITGVPAESLSQHTMLPADLIKRI